MGRRYIQVLRFPEMRGGPNNKEYYTLQTHTRPMCNLHPSPRTKNTLCGLYYNIKDLRI